MDYNPISSPSPVLGDRTPCWRLFNIPFEVSVKSKHYNYIQRQIGGRERHTSVISSFGMDRETLQNNYDNQFINVKITPVILTQYVKAGFPIAFKSLEDAKSIFADIRNHFANWISVLSSQYMYREPPPLADLYELEGLSVRIFTLVDNIVFDLNYRKVGITEFDKFTQSRGYDAPHLVKKQYHTHLPELITLIIKKTT